MTAVDDYPWLGEPFLEFYREGYERVFVTLHPFFRLSGADPARIHHGARVLFADMLPEENRAEHIMRAARQRLPDDPPPDFPRQIKAHAAPLSWRMVAEAAGLPSIAALNRALLTAEGALNRRYDAPGAAMRLTDWCEAEKVFRPTDALQPLMEAGFAELAASLGLEALTLTDEFGKKTETAILTDLRGPATLGERVDDPKKLSGGGLLVVAAFDRFVTLICLGGEAAGLRPDLVFEGFWADEATGDGWWVDFEPRPG